MSGFSSEYDFNDWVFFPPESLDGSILVSPDLRPVQTTELATDPVSHDYGMTTTHGFNTTITPWNEFDGILKNEPLFSVQHNHHGMSSSSFGHSSAATACWHGCDGHKNGHPATAQQSGGGWGSPTTSDGQPPSYDNMTFAPGTTFVGPNQQSYFDGRAWHDASSLVSATQHENEYPTTAQQSSGGWRSPTTSDGQPPSYDSTAFTSSNQQPYFDGRAWHNASSLASSAQPFYRIPEAEQGYPAMPAYTSNYAPQSLTGLDGSIGANQYDIAQTNDWSPPAETRRPLFFKSAGGLGLGNPSHSSLPNFDDRGAGPSTYGPPLQFVIETPQSWVSSANTSPDTNFSFGPSSFTSPLTTPSSSPAATRSNLPVPLGAATSSSTGLNGMRASQVGRIATRKPIVTLQDVWAHDRPTDLSHCHLDVIDVASYEGTYVKGKRTNGPDVDPELDPQIVCPIDGCMNDFKDRRTALRHIATIATAEAWSGRAERKHQDWMDWITSMQDAHPILYDLIMKIETGFKCPNEACQRPFARKDATQRHYRQVCSPEGKQEKLERAKAAQEARERRAQEKRAQREQEKLRNMKKNAWKPRKFA